MGQELQLGTPAEPGAGAGNGQRCGPPPREREMETEGNPRAGRDGDPGANPRRPRTGLSPLALLGF
eukprot:7340240-Alexandrium_andersonii.AAC.1